MNKLKPSDRSYIHDDNTYKRYLRPEEASKILDRMSLSMKNKWLDKENRVYIIYQISEIMENLNMAEKTAIKTLTE